MNDDGNRPTYVYVAGPYTGGDVCENVRSAMALGHVLMDGGYVPFVPHLSHFLHLHRARPYEDWMWIDLAWLQRCDVLVRLPGYSPGANREEAKAGEWGIPVVRLRGDESPAEILALVSVLP